MLESDDLTRVADVALGRVQPDADVIHTETRCHVDHGDIARAGVEEGLKLALRMLHDRFGSTRPLSVNVTTDRRAVRGWVPAASVEPRYPGGNR